MDPIKYSIVIPCYNEEGAIENTIDEVTEVMSPIQAYEIIVVNDGSTDATDKILSTLQNKHNHLRVINQEKNRGYGASLKTGIKHAKGEFIAITDADGSYPIDQPPNLLKAIPDYDMVVGARITKDVVYPFIRKIPKFSLKRYPSWLSGVNIPDINSGLRVFRKKIYTKFMHVLPDGFSFTTTITMAMLTNGYRVKYLPIGYHARIGKSKIRPIRDTLNSLRMGLKYNVYFVI